MSPFVPEISPKFPYTLATASISLGLCVSTISSALASYDIRLCLIPLGYRNCLPNQATHMLDFHNHIDFWKISNAFCRYFSAEPILPAFCAPAHQDRSGIMSTFILKRQWIESQVHVWVWIAKSILDSTQIYHCRLPNQKSCHLWRSKCDPNAHLLVFCLDDCDNFSDSYLVFFHTSQV